jgi:hypothetical protein
MLNFSARLFYHWDMLRRSNIRVKETVGHAPDTEQLLRFVCKGHIVVKKGRGDTWKKERWKLS